MNRLHRFLKCPLAERRVLLEAFIVVSLVRLGLTTIPFRRFRQFAIWYVRVPRDSAADGRMKADQVVWGVTAASRYVPAATCLTQAIASQVVLARHGYLSDLRIGVAKDPAGEFGAHAWLELHGRVIVGNTDLANYTPLPSTF